VFVCSCVCVCVRVHKLYMNIYMDELCIYV